MLHKYVPEEKSKFLLSPRWKTWVVRWYKDEDHLTTLSWRWSKHLSSFPSLLLPPYPHTLWFSLLCEYVLCVCYNHQTNDTHRWKIQEIESSIFASYLSFEMAVICVYLIHNHITASLHGEGNKSLFNPHQHWDRERETFLSMTTEIYPLFSWRYYSFALSCLRLLTELTGTSTIINASHFHQTIKGAAKWLTFTFISQPPLYVLVYG